MRGHAYRRQNRMCVRAACEGLVRHNIRPPLESMQVSTTRRYRMVCMQSHDVTTNQVTGFVWSHSKTKEARLPRQHDGHTFDTHSEIV